MTSEAPPQIGRSASPKPQAPSRLLILSLAAACALNGCGPKVAPQIVAKPAPPTYEQKFAAILQLEDERQLRSAAGDLLLFLQDSDPRLRRRAALATGRVKLAEAIAGLQTLLGSDPDSEVKQMAAFALGLIGDASAGDALTTALADRNSVIQGRAAEALGLVGQKTAAPAIGAMMAAHLDAGVLNGLSADDLTSPMGPAIEAVRLGLCALVRLGAYETLAATLIDKAGQPRSKWWPVAYAFQRVDDVRSVPALLALLQSDGQFTRAFAIRGLAASKDPRVVSNLVDILSSPKEPQAVRIQAIRGVGAMNAAAAVPALIRMVSTQTLDPNLHLEALTALATLHPRTATDFFIDLASARSPAVRSAALRGLSRVDADLFVSAISGLDPDQHWSVRASLATTLGELGQERAEPPLTRMLADTDTRVLPAVLDALVKVGATNARQAALDHLANHDPVVRAAAARGLASLKAQGVVAPLAAALEVSRRDGLYVARAATLEALAALDPVAAQPQLAAALGDRDWAIRVRAAELLRKLDPAVDLSAMRPAPPAAVPELNDVHTFIAPPVSPTAYVDTDKGTIQFELAVIDAPRTVANFVALVRKGYFNGVALHRVVPDFVIQDGDPRGDGEGGPGYTIRDELSQRQFLRGTVGMALDWADTGGSQFFITHSPQPHLDARYTVFGQVHSGMEVVDRLSQWDTIVRIRVWDGVAWIGPQ
jgi:cyclophilin family peptidyl-prolyl cis-trans isomerase/HEAT repeat protein